MKLVLLILSFAAVFASEQELKNIDDPEALNSVINGREESIETLIDPERKVVHEMSEIGADMEELLGRSRWCRKRDGICRNHKTLPKCPHGNKESPKGRPYCMGRNRRCCYPGEEGPDEAIACEHGGVNLSINCTTWHVIKIIQANYGRTSNSICNDQGRTWPTNCHGANSFKVMVDRCNGRSSCSVPPSNSVFGDPCGGVFKYLEVQYECVKASPKEQ